MTQQTALDWLEDNLIGNPHTEKDFMHNKNVFQEAKQMEKKQMIDFTNEWFTEYLEGVGDYKTPKQYYNETFGGL
jgi:hypothetical protein